MSKLLVAFVVIACTLCSVALAADFPATSAIGDLGGGRLLLVDDTKNAPETAGRPRFRVLDYGLPAVAALHVVSEDWGDNTLPNDLEAIAPIPGQPGRFLVSESSYMGSNYGRIFYIEVTENAGTWSSRVFGVAQLPVWLRGEVEGIALGAKPAGGLTLVISERGGAGPYSPAQLWWGDFDLSTGAFTMAEDAQWGIQLLWPDKTCDPWARPCTDLYLDGAGYLWASGAEDMGENGPFRSVVYRVGRFDPKQPYPIMYEMTRELVWRIDGLKVEALGPPLTPGSILTIATDDETYGGVWRPLPPVDPQPERNPPYYGEYGG